MEVEVWKRRLMFVESDAAGEQLRMILDQVRGNGLRHHKAQLAAITRQSCQARQGSDIPTLLFKVVVK